MRFLLLFAFAAAAFAQESIDQIVEKARKTFDVPGIGVAVVKDGQVVFAKGVGVRKLGEPAPVTANTLFGIASNTKAFTAASTAARVPAGSEPTMRCSRLDLFQTGVTSAPCCAARMKA